MPYAACLWMIREQQSTSQKWRMRTETEPHHFVAGVLGVSIIIALQYQTRATSPFGCNQPVHQWTNGLASQEGFHGSSCALPHANQHHVNCLVVRSMLSTRHALSAWCLCVRLCLCPCTSKYWHMKKRRVNELFYGNTWLDVLTDENTYCVDIHDNSW